jgi:hypothetical protein
MNTTMHNCGGTILTADGQDYCDRCGAFMDSESDEEFPTGTDAEANQAASDAGDDRSPEA